MGPLALKKYFAILDLRHNALGSVDFDALFALRELDLSHNDLRQIGSLPPNLDQLRRTTALPRCQLYPSVSPPSPSSTTSFASCRCCRRRSQLQVAHNKLASIDLSPCAARCSTRVRMRCARRRRCRRRRCRSSRRSSRASSRSTSWRRSAAAAPRTRRAARAERGPAARRQRPRAAVALRVLDVSNNELGERLRCLGTCPSSTGHRRRQPAPQHQAHAVAERPRLSRHTRAQKVPATRGPPPAGSGYLDEENDGGGGGDAPATLDEADVRAAARGRRRAAASST